LATRKPATAFHPFSAICLDCGRLVQILLKSRKNYSDFFRLSQLGDGIGDGMVLQPEQRRKFFRRQFFRAGLDVLRKNEIEESLLLTFGRLDIKPYDASSDRRARVKITGGSNTTDRVLRRRQEVVAKG
jgi:hypothetical protein